MCVETRVGGIKVVGLSYQKQTASELAVILDECVPLVTPGCCILSFL